MKMMTRLVLGTALLGSLSACGEGGKLPGGPSEFEVLDAMNGELHDAYARAQITAEADMPSAGTANYTGAAFFVDGSATDVNIDDRSNTTMVSRVSIDVDFAGEGSIDGEFTDFATDDPEVENLEGRLAMSNAILRGNMFDANLDGSLTSSQGTRTVDGVLAGAFVGERAGAVSGLLEAELIDTEANQFSVISGSFVAVEN
jgi:hypothetical protein